LVPSTTECCRPVSSTATTNSCRLGGSYRSYELEGRLDEGRVARVARSPAWIAAEFANQSDPEAFVRVLQ
jgi:hypothetical protein